MIDFFRNSEKLLFSFSNLEHAVDMFPVIFNVCAITKDLGRYFCCCKTCILLKIGVWLSCFQYDKILLYMLHKISFASIAASHNIVAVWCGAAHETVPKISKSDILQHFDAVAKSFIQNAVKFMICITCHQLILLSPANAPLYLTTRLCLWVYELQIVGYF